MGILMPIWKSFFAMRCVVNQCDLQGKSCSANGCDALLCIGACAVGSVIPFAFEEHLKMRGTLLPASILDD
jgi:hypothetical protein